MMGTLFGRTVYEKRWFIIGWSLVFGVTSTLVLMFYPSFSQGGGFDEVTKTLPEQLQGLVGDPSVFATLEGFISSQVYDVRMSLMMIIMTLVLATGLTVREEENGDLRTMMMTSLSRSRVVLEKFAAALCVIVILNLVATAGIYIGIVSLGETAPHALIWQLFALTCLFGATAFSIPYAVALATGRRAITMVVGLLVAIGSYMLTTFARSVDWLESWDKLSLMHYFNTASVREGSFDTIDALVLFLILVIAMITAIAAFRSRDIA
jgi:ABC-2 type transport system permease protein